MKKILIIEDDNTFSTILERYLSKMGFDIVIAPNIKIAKTLIQSNIQLILLDFHLPDGDGFDVLQFLNSTDNKIPTIIMTSFHDIKIAVNSIKKGAVDFITKPIHQEELLMLIEEHINYKKTSSTPKFKQSVDSVKGHSELSRNLYKLVDLVAGTEMSVLINGESGTGKEHVARALHHQSKRAHKPFVAIDCGALSPELAASELFGHIKGAFTGAMFDKKGQLEMANEGTIFLDEIGNLSYEVQVKLLRVIQERILTPIGSNQAKSVDVRIIAATNENFAEAIANGKFREDLYHRINEFTIKMPSLAERKEDLPVFVDYFIEEANTDLNKEVIGIDKAVQKIFQNYHWPGNIRELKNVIKRAVLLTQGDIIMLDALPEEMEFSISMQAAQAPAEGDLKQAQESLEKELILKTLKETNYNKSKTAKILKIDRTTLYNKLAKYEIES